MQGTGFEDYKKEEGDTRVLEYNNCLKGRRSLESVLLGNYRKGSPVPKNWTPDITGPLVLPHRRMNLPFI